jgi:hypothetical protein
VVKKKYIIIFGVGAGITGLTLYLIYTTAKNLSKTLSEVLQQSIQQTIQQTTQQPTQDVIQQVQQSTTTTTTLPSSNDVSPTITQQSTTSQPVIPQIGGGFIPNPPPLSPPLNLPPCTCPSGTIPMKPGEWGLARQYCSAPEPIAKCPTALCVPQGGWLACWNQVQYKIQFYTSPQYEY